MSSKNIIIANWKSNPNSEEKATKLFRSVKSLSKTLKNSTVIICPPVVFLKALASIGILTKCKLGIQDISAYDGGAHTGEISVSMVKAFGVSHVIVGHSERRASGETNIVINEKIKTILEAGLIPVLCIGEREREHGMWYLHEVKKQLEENLRGINKNKIKKIIFAYEPVWAIGARATRVATPEESLEMSIYIRKVLSDLYDTNIAKTVSIIYGGSVDERNASSFIEHGGVHGFLVGRASLDPKQFITIAQA